MFFGSERVSRKGTLQTLWIDQYFDLATCFKSGLYVLDYVWKYMNKNKKKFISFSADAIFIKKKNFTLFYWRWRKAKSLWIFFFCSYIFGHLIMANNLNVVIRFVGPWHERFTDVFHPNCLSTRLHGWML